MEVSEEGDNRWWWLLLGSSGFLYAIAIVFTIVMYALFCRDAEACQKNVAFVTINLMLCLLFSFLSIHPKVQEGNPRSGLLQSGLITAYATYLVFSALMSDTETCNPWKTTSGALDTSALIGALFTIIAVLYATIRAASAAGGYTSIQEEQQPLTKHDEKADKDKDSKEKEEKKEKAKDEDEEAQETPANHHNEPVDYHYSRFHAVFALGAMYLAMLMTDWNTLFGSDQRLQADTGPAAVWVKASTSWLVCGLYIWTLVAPVVMSDREW